MDIQRCTKESFTVIGIEGSTNDGMGFIQKLWQQANSRFGEVQHLAKRDANGNLMGIWGAMSDMSRSFRPWQKGFSEGLYLAGIEARDDAEAPNGWVKWVLPASEYIYVENEGDDTFTRVIEYMRDNDIELVGAAYDFNSPENGKGYTFFPIRRL